MGTCVETKPRGIEASCIVSVTGTTPHKFTFPVRAVKTLAEASKRGYSILVCVCLQTQSMMELNQKLTKACQEDARYGAFTCRKNTYVRTWGLERGEGICLKGAYFRELTVNHSLYQVLRLLIFYHMIIDYQLRKL